MFEGLLSSGETLSARLESNLKLSQQGSARHRPSEIVSFTEIDTWYAEVLEQVTRTLGPDPKARVDYMWQLFKDEWGSANRVTPTSLERLRGVLYLLRAFATRLDPANAQRGFDWSEPPDMDNDPPLPEIEAKRWEFFKAMLQDAQKHAPGTFDPLTSAGRIALHPFHAREFFISLVRSGHVNREWLTKDWKELAEKIDKEDVGGSTPSPTLRALSIFFCHASEDKLAVRELSAMVRKWGHEPWLDEDKLLPGQDWDREIRRAIERADVVIVCLSERCEKRGYVQKEIKRALDIADEQPEGAIFVIPVKLTECSVPDRLSKTQWVNLSLPSGPSKLEAALRLCATKQ